MTERDKIIQQHVGWILQYLSGMTDRNWADMRDRALRQADELSNLIDGQLTENGNG